MINTFRSVAQFDRITLDPVERRLKAVASVEDFRRIWPFFRDRRIDAYDGLKQRWRS